MLKIGTQAPNFKAPDQNEKEHELQDFAGEFLLLYFYPKDDTSGCTQEACAFRDVFKGFKKHNVAVVGVSADSIEKHDKFADKFRLPFTLLSDPEKKMIEAYEAWGEKSFMGKTYNGILRISYLIDPKGKIVKTYENVVPEEHAAEVLKDVEELKAS